MTLRRRTVLALPGAAVLAGMFPGGTRGATPTATGIIPVPGVKAGVTFDAYSLFIGGQRVYLWSGEFHYWRLPSPDLWRDVLQKYKAAGLNAASVYFHWGFHSPAQGVYDFTGVRDVNRLLDIAREVGIWITARPGPYINGETDAGGYPGWLLNQAGRARSNAPDYLAACDEWFTAINRILAPQQAPNGGPVILYQIENEYAFVGPDKLHTDPPSYAIAYMQALEAKVAADGIVVPTFHNDKGRHDAWRPGLPGATKMYAFDAYPGNTTSSDPNHWSPVPDWAFERTLGALTTPLFQAETQGGWLDILGGHGYPFLFDHISAAFQRVYYKNDIAAGLTMQSFYMMFGGTSWGWLPFDTGYTSYDYGATISEARQLTNKYAEDKKLGYFVAAVTPLLVTDQMPDTVASDSTIRVRTMTNPLTGTVFYTLIHQDTTSQADTRFTFPVTVADGTYPSVPQSGTLQLNGHDAKILVAGYDMERQRLVYSTSEIMTHARYDAVDLAILYGRPGEQGETVLRYSSEPLVGVLQGSALTSFDAATGDLRVNAIHGDGLTLVATLGGGTAPLLLGIADDNLAASIWRFDTVGGVAILIGPYLVRTVEHHGLSLIITGDTITDTTLEVFAPIGVVSLVWNGRLVSAGFTAHGSLRGAIPGPGAVTLPSLGDWRTQTEAPESQPGFDDANWLNANRTTTNNPTKPAAGQPVLYADDYGFHHGDLWYRARFTATGSETGITLVNNNGVHGSFLAWLNGVPIGGARQPGTQTLDFPAGVLTAGAVNIIALLCENLGHAEDGGSNDAHKSPRGLLSAALAGSSANLAWKIQGVLGGEAPADPVRGAYNNGGLFGERAGWHLPRFPDAGWAPALLPATQSTPGVSWYRTEFSLDIPDGLDVSIGLQITDTPTRNSRARLFVNGWHMGFFINQVGPQTLFVIPNGILRTSGTNTLAIAVISDGTGGLGTLSLVPLGTTAGGVPIGNVQSPAYDPSIWTG